jgi:hypothetical protein
MFAQPAAVQVAETSGAVTVATDGPRDVDEILATVPAHNVAHEEHLKKCCEGEFTKADVELA